MFVLVSKLLSHPNSLRLGENSVHSLSHESHKRRSDGFEQMQKKSRKVSPNCDSISPVHRSNLGVCSWPTPWVPNMMSRLILRFYVLVCGGLATPNSVSHSGAKPQPARGSFEWGTLAQAKWGQCQWGVERKSHFFRGKSMKSKRFKRILKGF